MSTITGNGATYPASFEGPDDGDERDAASHLVGFEALADRTEYLKDRVVDGTAPINTSALTVVGDATIGDDLAITDNLTVGGAVLGGLEITGGNLEVDGNVEAAGDLIAAAAVEGTAYRLPSARTVEVVIDGGAETDAGSGWELDRTTNDFFWVTTSTSQSKLRIPLNAFLQNGVTITQLVARFDAAGGHGALPGGIPELILYRKRVGTTGAASGIIDSAFDPSANTTAFQAEHDIPLVLGTPHTVNLATHAYYAIITSEDGSDSFAGAQYHGLRLTYTYTRLDKS